MQGIPCSRAHSSTSSTLVMPHWIAILRSKRLERVRGKVGTAGVRAEVLVPDQSKGDIAKIALFPNPAREAIGSTTDQEAACGLCGSAGSKVLTRTSQ